METLPTNNEDVFMNTLQSRLLNQSDLISSATSNMESSIAKAIENVKAGNEASKSAIESSYGRERSYLEEQNNQVLTATRERGAGVQTADVAYRAMAAEADKSIKDLMQRKEELILQGDAAAAAKTSELILKAQEMKISGMQQTFQNLLSAGNFGLARQQEARAQRQMLSQEKQAVASIALEYGIPVGENDTIDTIVSKAAPFASQEQKLKLAKMTAEIAQANAQAAKARSDISNGGIPDPKYMPYYIDWAAGNWSEFSTMNQKNPDLVGAVRNSAISKQEDQVYDIVYSRILAGEDEEAVVTDITKNYGAISQVAVNKKVTEAAEAATKVIIEHQKSQPKITDYLKVLGKSVSKTPTSSNSYMGDFFSNTRTSSSSQPFSGSGLFKSGGFLNK